jgi:hypothetical protein
MQRMGSSVHIHLSSAVCIEGAVILVCCGRLTAMIRDTGETTEFDSGPVLNQRPNEYHVLVIMGGLDFLEFLTARQQISIFFLFCLLLYYIVSSLYRTVTNKLYEF